MKDLKALAAVYEAECDREWMFFEEHAEELESKIEGINDDMVIRAITLVIVQAYVKGMNRTFEELDER
jgi:hypothetical protein